MKNVQQLRDLGLFDARVPRYTSYPTAARFTDAVGSAQTAEWLRAMPAGTDISLYVHVPFCRRLCWFCACRTQGTSTLAPLLPYLATIKQEIGLIAEELPPGTRLARLHWGGGTPTLLSRELIAELAGAIFERLPLAPGAEFSVEIDPTELDEERMDALAAVGLTRASVGIQDFDPAIQALIGRSQSYAETRAAVEGLRDRGVLSLNADMLYGLPDQTPQQIAESMQQLLSLTPDRVALFGYAHVPWMARRQAMIRTESLPGPEARLDLFETARELLAWDGYREIGIDHFARPTDGLARAAATGELRRNFQGYTDDPSEVLIGIGASAISRFPQGYAQNAAATAPYQAAVRGGRLATARGHAFAGEDLLRSDVIEALMCEFAVDLEAVARRHDADPGLLEPMAASALATFADVLERDGPVLRITRVGRPLARIIARSFDAYAMDPAGHSAAI
ncbi:oxygen-independent coproporphyrinogen III oxidase [Pontivivens ytuae]|uniref:Coproporphyrinogen-III oxidase n=1 Tax=Pontivivens ytuae TaxID=2789856 RepID=A0A7S9LRY3_9RHOB|nr:oxygen-independent coproporphyrinogen III oxidase [Pontivivens ytuae]QPH54194.1 oxygen-independent coproporphyrinogen III oxidase [Pontivivens ytuae]